MAPKKEPIKFILNGELVLGKVCTRCGILKEFNDYPRNNQKSDGYNSYCKDCKKKADKQYYEEHKDKVTNRVREYYQEKMKDQEFVLKERERSKEKHLKYGDKYRLHYRVRYHTDKDFLTHKKIKDKQWREENRIKVNLKSARRRAFLKRLPSTLTSDEWEIVLKKFDGKCALTGESDNITIEHFIPLAIGHGGHIKGNVYPVKAGLNLSKNIHNPFEWILRPDVSSVVSQERWNTLIEYLASENELTVQEFKDYTNWCFDNRRKPYEITDPSKTSLSLWREYAYA